MSRSGTLQDALRSVDGFQKAALLLPARLTTSAVRGDVEDIKQDTRGRHSRKKREKDGRKSSKRDKERRRRKEVTVRGCDNEESDEDGNNPKERRRSERKKKDRRKHRKERKLSSGRAERKAEKKSSQRREKGKWQSRRLQSSEDHSSASEDEDSISGSKSSESEDGDTSLRAEQIAVNIMEEFPEVTDDLQQLLQMVDNGQAVDISGIPDKRLVTRLEQLFLSLRMKKSQAGLYLLPVGSQSTLERLRLPKKLGQAKARTESGKAHQYGPEALIPSIEGRPSQADDKNCDPMFPGVQSLEGSKKHRVIGPAMPSAEMLAAAARLAEAEEVLRNAEAALENDPMIGPPPPAAVAEASSANDAERFEEVTRLMAPDVGDAYELLGLKREVNAADLKKRYWKLSLLVHPDKCPHPQAHDAFMALNKAFKDLQDPVKRTEIDRKADQKLAQEEYEADMKARREAAQWRKLRGEEALPGDAQLLQGDVIEQARDEWMTDLPPERQAGKTPSQQNTFFSRSERAGRGDTSAWTDTPLEKAQRAKMQYLEAYNQAAVTGPEEIGSSSIEKEKAAKVAVLMDQYNQKKRSLSLLEEHQQKSIKVLKAKKKKGQTDQKKEEWAETHPWKPWDREKDLAAGRQVMKWTDKKSAGEGLSSRFGSSVDGRNFL